MIITCPECKTRYIIKSEKLGVGKKQVKCAKCEHQWIVSPMPEEEDMKKPPLPPIARLDGFTNDLKSEQKELNSKINKKKNIVLFMFFLSLLSSIASFFVFKDKILEIEPQLKSVYELIGVELPKEEKTFSGLEIKDVERELTEGENLSVLSFSGIIVNNSDVEVPVPNVKVQLFDEGNVLLDDWIAQPENKTLKPGETTTWICRFYNAQLSQISQFKTFLIEE